MLGHLDKMPEKIILLNSFFGLEKHTMLPPNITMTGSLTQRDTLKVMQQFKEKDKKLFQWVQKASEESFKIFIISLGSEVRFEPWAIDAIYQGCLKVRGQIKFVWAI